MLEQHGGDGELPDYINAKNVEIIGVAKACHFGNSRETRRPEKYARITVSARKMLFRKCLLQEVSAR